MIYRISCLVALIATFVLSSSGNAAEPATKPSGDAAAVRASAEIVFLQVAKPLSNDLQRAFQNMPRRSEVFQQYPRITGTDMLMVVRLPDHAILSAPEDALQVQMFIDDKYQDLGRGKRESRNQNYYGGGSGQSPVAENGHAVLLPISSDRAPSDGASRIFLRGSVTLKTGKGEKTSERQKLPLRIGKTIDVGPAPLTLRSISDVGQGLQLNFTSDQSIEAIQAIRFIGLEGKDAQARINHRNDRVVQGGGQGGQPSSINFSIPQDVDEVEVEVKYIEKIETVTIPIELQADLGAVTITAPDDEGPKDAAPTEREKANAPAPEPQSATPPRQEQKKTGESAQAKAPAQAAARSPFPATRPAMPAFSDARKPWPPKPSDFEFPPRKEIPWPTTRPVIPARAGDGVVGAQADARVPTTRPAALPGVKLDLVGLTVGQYPPESLGSVWSTRPEIFFRPIGGTNIRLVVSVPDDATILDIQEQDIRIDRFADDTGRELSTALHSMQSSQQWGVYPFYRANDIVSTNSRHAILTVPMQDAPTRGATRVLLSGDVVARVGTHERTVEQRDVALEPGTTIEAGPVSLKVQTIASTYTGLPNQGGGSYPILVSFQSNGPVDRVRKLVLLDESGKVVPGVLQMPNFGHIRQRDAQLPEGMSPPGEPRSFSYLLSRDVARATVKLTYLEKVETGTVPIEVMTGIGL